MHSARYSAPLWTGVTTLTSGVLSSSRRTARRSPLSGQLHTFEFYWRCIRPSMGNAILAGSSGDASLSLPLSPSRVRRRQRIQGTNLTWRRSGVLPRGLPPGRRGRRLVQRRKQRGQLHSERSPVGCGQASGPAQGKNRDPAGRPVAEDVILPVALRQSRRTRKRHTTGDRLASGMMKRHPGRRRTGVGLVERLAERRRAVFLRPTGPLVARPPQVGSTRGEDEPLPRVPAHVGNRRRPTQARRAASSETGFASPAPTPASDSSW